MNCVSLTAAGIVFWESSVPQVARGPYLTEPPVDSPQSLSDWPLPWPRFEVDWTHAGLMVIDFQDYVANPTMGLTGTWLARNASAAQTYVRRITDVCIPNTSRLLNAFRQAGQEVIFTRHGALLPDGRDLIERRRRRDRDAQIATDQPAMWPSRSLEHQIVEQLAPLSTELVIDKNSSSPFNATGIDQLLRNLGIKSIVLAGLATDMCVETTARDAADRGYNVIVVADATATFYESHHRAALSSLARVYAQVWSTEKVLAHHAEHL